MLPGRTGTADFACPGKCCTDANTAGKAACQRVRGEESGGGAQLYAVLNQVDTEEQAVLARQTADILKKRYSVPCILTHFEKGERA